MFEQSILEGRESELKFEALAKMRGFLVKPATGIEQIDHVDFHLTSEEEDGTMSAMVDVKARKKTSRKDNKYNDDWVWIEFKNVQGKDGWIYGDADFIVFERENDFIFVNRQELVDWLGSCKKIRYDLPFVTLAKLARYKIYQRRGRRDEITQVKMSDILKLESAKKWSKT